VTAPERADVVVVGGGLLGLSTAWALRGRREVLVLERFAVGHARGGSHGPSRIFRLGYSDPRYVEMGQRALGLWRRIEAERGAQLLHPVPQLTIGPGAHEVFAALTGAGVPVERMTAAAIGQRFPAFAGRGDGVLETTSAVIAADRTLDALRAGAGAEVREHVRVERVDAQRVWTAEGVIEARSVVVCAGPWTSALVPSVATRTTLEHVAYVRAGAELPIFIDFTAPAVYGLPTPGSDVYKVAVHHGGPAVDPESEFRPDGAAVAALHDALATRLPAAELVDIDVCPYDNTPDEHFIVDCIDGVVVGAGTSGHAFKFGPLLGAQLAQLVGNAANARD
jgi:sarcosine oxidase